MASSEFEELRHQASQLTADIEMVGELPRVERSLYQLRDMAIKLAGKAPDHNHMKASLLLGSRGFDISKMSEKLESLSRLNTFEPLQPLRDVDVQGYLKNEHGNALLAAVEQTRRSTFEEASNLSWQRTEDEWNRHRHKVLTTLCDFSTDASSMLTDESINDTIMYSTNYYRLSRTSPNHQAYDDVICRHNTSQMEGGTQQSLVDMFKQLASQNDDQAALEMWTLVGYMVKVERRSAIGPLVNQSLAFLEKSYLSFIERMVSSNLQEARQGGVPSKLNLIISYFNARHNAPYAGAEDGLLEGHPVWAVVYQCLRCGDQDALANVVEKAMKLIGDFADVLKEYKESPQRKLSVPSQKEVKLRYRRTVCNSSDPYKRLVYCLMAKCDLQDDHPDVATTTDDYLWLKLSMVDQDEEEEDGGGSNSCAGGGGSGGGVGGGSFGGANTSGSGRNRSRRRSLNKSFDAGPSGDKFSLAQLQSLLLENYGESHFNAHQQPLLFSKILFLIGQFEGAVEFLFRFDPHRHLAVHIACTLHSHRLLLLPHNYNTHLLSKDPSDSAHTRRLNLVHLITTFNHTFEHHDPTKALHYYYLLRSIKALESDTDLFTHSLCQLVIANRDFDLILGQTQSDGSRKPGLVDKFRVDPDKVIERVAVEVEGQGHMVDAVRLYDLAKKHDKVLELLTQLLSQVVSQPSKPRADQLKQIALQFANRPSYQTLTSPLLTSFHLLLDLSSFFQAYHSGDHQEAYNIMRELNLVSLSPNSLEGMIKRVHSLCREVKRCIPEILLATAHCIYQLYKELALSSQTSMNSVDDASRKTLMNEYRAQLQSVVSFSGSMMSRMPSHVTAQLVSLEASIK